MKVKESLGTMITKLAGLESAPDDFDPAVLVGDVKDKLDAIRYQMLKWDSEADKIEEEIVQPFQRSADSLRKKSERLGEYVKQEMLRHGFDKLPGRIFYAAFQKTAPVVSVEYEADAKAYEAYPEFVEKEDSYRWARRKIKEAIDLGNKLPFATLRQNRSFRFRAFTKSNETIGAGEEE